VNISHLLIHIIKPEDVKVDGFNDSDIYEFIKFRNDIDEILNNIRSLMLHQPKLMRMDCMNMLLRN
jgi:hypothetical protein